MLTDLGTNFTSKVLNQVNKFWGITHSFATAYHPQCDGMVERFNRTLGTMLATLLEPSQRNWDILEVRDLVRLHTPVKK